MAAVQVGNLSAVNKAHFDKTAHEFDHIPFAKERSERTAEAFRKVYTFDEKTTVMEYACGTGLVSKELAPFCKRLIGVDISQGMVDLFNKRPNQNMQGVCVELKGEPGELGDEKFDVIVCASAYHHFESINDVTRMLAYFLKPGGALLVVDILQAEHWPVHTSFVMPDDAPGVAHKHGLGESDIRKAFESAGLTSFSFDAEALISKQISHASHDHHGHGPHDQEGAHAEDAHLFLAKGIKSQGWM